MPAQSHDVSRCKDEILGAHRLLSELKASSFVQRTSRANTIASFQKNGTLQNFASEPSYIYNIGVKKWVTHR